MLGNLEWKLDFNWLLLLKEVLFKVQNSVCVGGPPVYSESW